MILQRSWRAASAWLAAALVSVVPSPGHTMTSPLQAKPCSVGDSKAPAICGTLLVYEDRVAKSGRSIPIHFILIKAKHASHHAIAYNPGGPGGSAIEAAPAFAEGEAAPLRDQHDILLVDNRGTGASAPQLCNFAPPAHPELYFPRLWPDALVKACRDRLAAHANLSLYSSSVAADDLDDVRAALGYEKLTLFGGSYGTRLYLVYVRQHPDRVESLVLAGVAPPHFYILPLPMAAAAQASMNNLIAACNADATCAKHFPSFGAHFAALVRRFDAGPVVVPLQNPANRGQSVRLSKEVFAETLRHTLYSANAAYIPVVVERAYHRDYAALASLIDQVRQQFAGMSAGLFLSVTCAEDIPFITEADVVRTSSHSFQGGERVRAQQRACRIWNVRAVPKSFIDPVGTDLPVLMISGTDDPATPPSYAKQAMTLLPNARMMLVKGASHQSDYPPCVYQAIASFVRSQSASQIGLEHCAAAYKRPAFATLTYFDSAHGENAALTARFRSLITELLKGRIDRAQLTPALSKDYPDAVLRQIASHGSDKGAMESFGYRGAHRSTKGMAYEYLAHFVQANANVTITLNAAGKVADMDISLI
ncbi:MAG: alpha/beta hydrolase [Candidatus Eremiobacteraeota bacterium]|nr:alpha/beta hydrolase [Candidatus Eremiobacteraeota bacterium]